MSAIVYWGLRGAAVGLGLDCFNLIRDNKTNYENTLINLVHGIAIGIIGSLFGPMTALCAAGIGALVTVAYALNSKTHDLTKGSIAARFISLYLGTTIGLCAR